MGLWGDNPNNSRSLTNPWLYCVSYNDGGDLRGTGTLYWTGGGFTNGTTVTVDSRPMRASRGPTWPAECWPPTGL